MLTEVFGFAWVSALSFGVRRVLPLGGGIRGSHWFLAVRGGRVHLVGRCVRALEPADQGESGPRCLTNRQATLEFSETGP